ncbi:hypothetical protein [Elizabethkingia meningoseptica]|uniref:hypothetical protein n=1 Tax=Elizabethkingia meningoseptica TaxID=238 RepID=UPI00093651FD|nr:hypothetical protein [Elizabethkingia meningoseptica]
MQKEYYLSGFRSKAIGIILMIVGISLFFIGFDINAGFWRNFNLMVLDFSGVFHFLFSLLILIFKVGFIIFGVYSLKYSGKVIRAKIDHKGLYFKEITGTNKYERLAFDLNPFIFIPYSEIKEIYIEKSFFRGKGIVLKTKDKTKKLITLDVLSNKEKEEIISMVRQHIKS